MIYCYVWNLTHITIITCVLGSAILAEGDNVNLKFAKSTVNVVTGDQINANKVVFNITRAEGEATPSSQGECSLIEYGVPIWENGLLDDTISMKKKPCSFYLNRKCKC